MNVAGTRCKRFPPEIEGYIRHAFVKGHTDQRMAAKIGCSVGAIEHFRLAVGLKRREGIRGWAQADIDTLMAMARAGHSVAEIAVALRRTKASVRGFAWARRVFLAPNPKVERRHHAHQPQRDEPPVAPPKADFGALMAGRRFEDSAASRKPQPIVVIHRPATHIACVSALA